MEKRITRYVEDPVSFVEAKAATEQASLNGYGAVYYDGSPGTEFKLWDGAVERIKPGAFDEAIEKDDVRALFNHNPDLILGRKSAGTLKLFSDKKGLGYSIVAGDTTVAKDVREHIKRGDVRGSSFSFMIPKGGERWQTEDGVDIRYLTKVRLMDVGPVTFPAYEGTVAGARIQGDPSDAKASHDEYKEKLWAKSYIVRAMEVEKESRLTDEELKDILEHAEEHQNNPFAICSAQFEQGTAKWEECVQAVKEKLGE